MALDRALYEVQLRHDLSVGEAEDDEPKDILFPSRQGGAPEPSRHMPGNATWSESAARVAGLKILCQTTPVVLDKRGAY